MFGNKLNEGMRTSCSGNYEVDGDSNGNDNDNLRPLSSLANDDETREKDITASTVSNQSLLGNMTNDPPRSDDAMLLPPPDASSLPPLGAIQFNARDNNLQAQHAARLIAMSSLQDAYLETQVMGRSQLPAEAPAELIQLALQFQATAPVQPPPQQPTNEDSLSLLHKLQLELLAQAENTSAGGISQNQSIPQQISTSESSSLQQALIEQLGALARAQTNQQIPAQSVYALTKASILHQLQASYQNQSSPPSFPQNQHQQAHQYFQSHQTPESSMTIGQLAAVALQLPQEQNSVVSSQTPTAADQMELLLQTYLSVNTDPNSSGVIRASIQNSQAAPLFNAPSPQNYSLNPLTDHQDQSQVLRNLVQARLTLDQLIESTLSPQQQEQLPSRITIGSTGSSQMPMAVDPQTELLLRSLSANFASNSSNQGSGIMLGASAQYSALQLPGTNNGINSIAGFATSRDLNMCPLEVKSPDILASRGHIHDRWMIRYEELKQFRLENGHCRVPHGYSQNRKLAWWVMNQRAQYQLLKRGENSWLTQDRVALLDAIGFIWIPLAAKSFSRK